MPHTGIASYAQASVTLVIASPCVQPVVVVATAHLLKTGLEFTRREIIAKIHIGEATLAKRVSEFATTAASSLTKDEFDARAREQEAEQAALLAGIPQDDNPDRDPARNCVHIGEPTKFRRWRDYWFVTLNKLFLVAATLCWCANCCCVLMDLHALTAVSATDAMC